MQDGDDDRAASALKQRLLDQTGYRYADAVIRHLMRPNNLGELPDPHGRARQAEACGDWIELSIQVEDNTVTAAAFLYEGCINTMACASAAVELASGRPLPEVLAISPEQLLEALGGLPEHNSHCAVLAVEALRASVRDYMATRDQPWKRVYRRR
jgi:nitrogen fixation NifU-like protein